MTAAQASKAKLIAAFGAIYIIWGSTYLAIKYAIATMPPFSMGAARFLIAGALLYAWARLRKNVPTTRRHWAHAFALGALLFGGGNGAVVWAQQHVESGIAALLVGVVPLWVVVIDWARPGGRRPTAAVMVGVIIGLIGMVLLIGPNALSAPEIDPLGTLVLICGSLSWSIATVFGRKAEVPGHPPLTAAMQMIGGGLTLCVMALVAGELPRVNADAFTKAAIIAFAYLITFGSLIAFTAYSWLMRVAPPARIATYAYVNPVVAILLGWAFAGEQLTVRTLAAAGIILTGVALITSGMNKGKAAYKVPAHERSS